MATTSFAELTADRSDHRPIITPPTLALAGIMATAMSSFYLLLSAIPAHAVTLGGDLAAGLATGALMGTTIVGELAAPRFIAHIGRRPAMAVALMVMAIPCLTGLSPHLSVVLLSCAARGFGLGVLLVATCGLATLLAPVARRAEALGVYGIASAIPAIICIPLGPWALAYFGPGTIAIIAATLAMVGLAGLTALPDRTPQLETDSRPHPLPRLRVAAWPAISLGLGAIIVGATITFLPIAHPEVGPGTIMLALLIQGLAAAAARWTAGRPIDRRGPQGAMIAGIVLAVGGALCLALSGSIAVITGMALSGIAFGVLQSASLAHLMTRASAAEVDGAGALWNVAYDAGLGIGGLAFGVLAAVIGYAASFVSAAAGLAALAYMIFRLFEVPRASCCCATPVPRLER